LIKVAEKYEKQKQLLMEAIKKKESMLSPFGAPAHNRDRRFSEVGLIPNANHFKPDRRHSDLTAYYYQQQLGLNLTGNNPPVFAASKSDNAPVLPFFPPVHPPASAAVVTNDASGPKSGSQDSKKTASYPVQVLEKNPLDSNSVKEPKDESVDGEAILENDEWCGFLDSQLEECLGNDLLVKECLHGDNT